MVGRLLREAGLLSQRGGAAWLGPLALAQRLQFVAPRPPFEPSALRHSSAQALTDETEIDAEEEHIATAPLSKPEVARVSSDPHGAPIVPILVAETRNARENGSRASRRLRQANRVPGVLFGQVRNLSTHRSRRIREQGRSEAYPATEGRLLTLALTDVQKLLRTYGSEDFLCTQPFMLRVLDPQSAATDEPQTFRVLPRNVHTDSVTRQPLNINFMHCPPDRRVKVRVPLRFVGVEDCVGLKRGGYLNRLMNTLNGTCRGDQIPPFIDVDISSLDLHRSVRCFDACRVSSRSTRSTEATAEGCVVVSQGLPGQSSSEGVRQGCARQVETLMDHKTLLSKAANVPLHFDCICRGCQGCALTRGWCVRLAHLAKKCL
eukprot:scaffold4762_cov398-Prasinococcus_capsulatus_cf.AAC.2